MTTGPRAVAATGRDDALGLLGRVARLLATGGGTATDDVLRAVLDADPRIRVLRLRRMPGGLLVARAGSESVDASWVLELPVRRGERVRAVLTVLAAEPFGPDQATLLGVLADLLGLAGAAADERAAAARAVLDVEADLAHLAADLDESIGEAIVALRHTHADNIGASSAAALAAVRRMQHHLRATALSDGLRAALAQLHSPAVTVDAEDPVLDLLPPATAVVVERVAEMACRAAVGKVRIIAFSDKQTVKLRVESADTAHDASELERWRRRVQALDGALCLQPWGVELELPVRTDPEGRDDDSPDL